MFGFGKPYRVQKHTATYYVIGAFVLAIEAALGVNAAFLINQFLQIMASSMLKGTSFESASLYAALFGSLFFGVCVMLGGLWSFGGFMDNLSDFNAYALDKGMRFRWPVLLIWLGVIGVMALDYFTLSFRMSYFQERGGTALFCFFLVLIPLPLLLGVIMHISKHVPHQQQIRRSQDHAVALSNADLQHAIESMDPDLLDQFASTGDTSLIQEHWQRMDERNKAYEQEKLKVKEDKRTRELQNHQPVKREGVRIGPFLVSGPKHQANGTDRSA